MDERFVISEEYERLNAVQSPIVDTEKDEYKKQQVKKPDSILLQKLMDKSNQEKSKGESISTQDTISSVITINSAKLTHHFICQFYHFLKDNCEFVFRNDLANIVFANL